MLAEVLEHPSHSEQIKTLFNAYDKNGSGDIDIKEFKKFAKDLVRFVAKYKNVDKREVIGDRSLEELIQTNFKIIDMNADGAISFEEFRSYVTGRGKFLS